MEIIQKMQAIEELKCKVCAISLGKLSILKSGKIWETVQSRDAPPPPPLAGLGLFWTWDFIEAELTPKKVLKQVEYVKYG